ncbi:74_t:CDS:2, partial [Acaulospora colombiana]
ILSKAAEVNGQETDLSNSHFPPIYPAHNSGEIIKDEQRSRREQSQRASQSIGQYLLSGWALIDEICPNESCFGSTLQFENASDAQVHISSSETRLGNSMSNDTLQESISSLSSSLRGLTDYLKLMTEDLGIIMNPNIKETCEAIRSCAQALEILVSLKQNKAES